jgi:hypothetical protein
MTTAVKRYHGLSSPQSIRARNNFSRVGCAEGDCVCQCMGGDESLRERCVQACTGASRTRGPISSCMSDYTGRAMKCGAATREQHARGCGCAGCQASNKYVQPTVEILPGYTQDDSVVRCDLNDVLFTELRAIPTYGLRDGVPLAPMDELTFLNNDMLAETLQIRQKGDSCQSLRNFVWPDNASTKMSYLPFGWQQSDDSSRHFISERPASRCAFNNYYGFS